VDWRPFTKSNEQNLANRSGRKVELFENAALFWRPQHPNVATLTVFPEKNGDF
jgi:hypothetical protein